MKRSIRFSSHSRHLLAVGESGVAVAELRNIDFQGLAPIVRDFYVFIPSGCGRVARVWC